MTPGPIQDYEATFELNFSVAMVDGVARLSSNLVEVSSTSLALQSRMSRRMINMCFSLFQYEILSLPFST